MAKNTISKDDVKHVAKLSNLPLSKDEVEYFAKAFTQTLDTINTLDEIDTKGVKRTYQVNGLENVYSAEDNVATLSKKDSLVNAGQEVDGMFATDAVFEKRDA